MWIREGGPKTYGSGSGTLVQLHHSSKIRSHKEVIKQKSRFSYYFCLTMEGSGAGSVLVTNGYGRPKNGSGSVTLPESELQCLLDTKYFISAAPMVFFLQIVPNFFFFFFTEEVSFCCVAVEPIFWRGVAGRIGSSSYQPWGSQI